MRPSFTHVFLICTALLSACNEQDNVAIISSELAAVAEFEKRGLSISRFDLQPTVSGLQNEYQISIQEADLLPPIARSVNALGTGVVILDFDGSYEEAMQGLNLWPGRRVFCIGPAERWASFPATCEPSESTRVVLEALAPLAAEDTRPRAVMLLIGYGHWLSAWSEVDRATDLDEVTRREHAGEILSQLGVKLIGVQDYFLDENYGPIKFRGASENLADTHGILGHQGLTQSEKQLIDQALLYARMALLDETPECSVAEWANPVGPPSCDGEITRIAPGMRYWPE